MSARVSILMAVGAFGVGLAACGAGAPEASDEPAAVVTTITVITTQPTITTAATTVPTATEPLATPSTAAAAPGFEERSFEHEGADEVYYLILPADCDGEAPRAVTLVLHGAATTALQVARSVEFATYTDDQGSIIVLPESTSVTVISALLDHLGDELSIDEGRVYAQGASAGGVLAARIGCELSDRVAAVGTGAGFGLPSPLACERPARPVPVTSFIGPYDPYFGLDEVMAAHAQWAEWNGCNPEPTTEEVATGVILTRWGGCSDDAIVELYVVDGLGHHWPGRCLPTAPAGICVEFAHFDGGALQWDFFVDHPMP